MQRIAHDLALAWRILANAPGFAAAAVLSLGIGIGANTALFSVTHALLLQPLPYADPDRLVILWNRSPGLNIAEDWFSTAQYFDIKTTHGGFDDVAIAVGANLNLTGDGDPERVGVIQVSSNLLPMLGARPHLGRLFDATDDSVGSARTAVLHYGTWSRRYGGDPGIVGQQLMLNGNAHEIIGVLPEGFSLPREVLPTLGVVDDGEVLLPLPLGPNAANIRTREDYNILGKLRRGVAVSEAQAEMDALTARLRREFPDAYPPNGGLTFSIVPLLDQVVGNVRRPLLVLLAAVGFVQLIACANVANLLLSRAVARRKEMAVRSALGATRKRLLGQMLTESLLIAVAGGLLGLAIAIGAITWIHYAQPASVPRLAGIDINGPVLAATTGLSVLSALLFGLAPAATVLTPDLQRSLKAADRGMAGAGSVWGRGNNMRRLLVMAELALSVVLLIGAGLLLRSFVSLQQVHPGFETRNVLTFELALTGDRYRDPAVARETIRELWTRLENLPGVASAGGVTTLPLTGRFAWGPMTAENRPLPAGQLFVNADMRTAGGQYFQTMGIELLDGRFFDDTDQPDSPRVVVIDDHMANEFWPGERAIGKRVRFGDINSTRPWETVVGVVGRVKHYGLDADTRIALYRPHTQSGARTMFVVVRTTSDASAAAADIRQVIRAIDADLPLANVATMEDRLEESLATRAFAMLALAVFAGLALVLSAIGTYGVVAYLVAQGRRELGIRIALGASQGAIIGLILRQGLVVALAGVGIGLVAALGLTRLMASLLYGVQPTDGATFAAIAGLLGAVALVASLVPARQAARIDPMITLRAE